MVLDFIEQYSRSISIYRWKWPQNALLYLRTIIADDPTHRIKRKVYPKLGLGMVYNFSLPNTGLRKSCRGVITLWMWIFTDFYRFLVWISIYIFTVRSANRLQPLPSSSNIYDHHNYRVLHLSERLQVVCNIDIWSKTRKNALFHYFYKASSSCIASISMLFRVSSTLIHIYNNLEIEWGVQLSYSSSTSLWKMEIYMIFSDFLVKKYEFTSNFKPNRCTKVAHTIILCLHIISTCCKCIINVVRIIWHRLIYVMTLVLCVFTSISVLIHLYMRSNTSILISQACINIPEVLCRSLGVIHHAKPHNSHPMVIYGNWKHTKFPTCEPNHYHINTPNDQIPG